MSMAFVFPGQGSQAVGMGLALSQASAVARQTLEEVDDALGQKLSALMGTGPAETLTLTANTQPAIMAASLAVVRVLEQEAGFRIAQKAAFVAGHSLGEYSALAAAGALDVAQTARLLRVRGTAMQDSVPVGAGAMAALLGLDLEAAQKVTAQAAAQTGQICACANDNGPGQVVISGDKAAVEVAMELSRQQGARKAVLLNVSAPFHCALMQPAADAMAAALATTHLRSPLVPLVANVTAGAVSEAAVIRDLLVAQVTGMVRWRESITTMVDAGVTTFVECGGGAVLAGLIRRISRDVTVHSVADMADIESLLKATA